MKKLLYLSTLLITLPLQAAHISHTDYTSGNTITASGQNANENAIVNEFNGNIDDTNIAAGGVKLTNLNSEVTAKFIPTGSFFYWVGSTNTVPTGFLYCNGAAVSRTTYAALFAVVGTQFGQGDNSTTFNLPDTRGYFVRGANDGSGNDPNAATRTAAATGGSTGDNIGSVETSTFTAHTHIASVTDPGHSHPEQTGSNGGAAVGIVSFNTAQTGVNVLTTNATVNVVTGVTVANANSGGLETRPININMAGIIKY